MGRYVSKTNLIHNNIEYPKGAIVELNKEEAEPLVLSGAVEATKLEIPPDQAAKIIDKFSAPSSTAEIEKAVDSATLVPAKRGKCPKCKVEREVRNPQVSQSGKGIIMMIGNCAICGTRISRMAGRVKIEPDKK